MARRLMVEIVGDQRGLTRAFNNANRQGVRFSSGMSRSMGPVGGLFSKASKTITGFGRSVLGALNPLHGLRGAIVGAAGAFAAFSFARSAVDTTDALAKASIGLHRALGLSIKTASAWASLAMSRGIDTKQLAQGFGLLSKQVYAAAHGSKSAITAFKELGVPVKFLKHAGVEKIVEKISDGMHKMAGGTQKTALMMKLFGRGWQTVVPLLRDGSKKVREQIKLARDYGATLDGKTIRSTEDWIKSQRESKLAMTGLKIAFSSVLLPALAKGAKAVARFVNWLRTNKTVGKVLHKVWHLLGDVLDWLKGKAEAIVSWFKAHWGAISKVVIGTWRSIKSKTKSIWEDIAGIVSDTFGGVKKTTAQNGEDVRLGLNRGGKGWKDTLKQQLDKLKRPFAGVWDWITDSAKNFTKIIRGVLNIFGGLLHADWSRVWKGIKQVFGGVAGAIMSYIKVWWTQISLVFSTSARIVGNLFLGLWKLLKTAAQKAGGAIADAIAAIWKALVTAATKAYDAAKTVGAKILSGLKAGWRTIKSVAAAALNAVRDAITEAAEKVWNAASKVGGKVLSGLKDGWSGVVAAVSASAGLFKSVIEKIVAAGTTVYNKAKQLGAMILSGLKAGWKGVVAAVGLASGIFGAIVGKIVDAAETIYNKAKAVGAKILGGLKAGWKGIVAAVGMASGIFGAIVGKIVDAAVTVYKKAKQVGAQLLAGVKAGWKGIVAAVNVASGVLGSVASAVFNAGKTVYNKAVHVGSRILAGIKEGASSIASWIKDGSKGLVGKIVNGLIAVPKQIYSWAKTVGEAIANAIKDGIISGFKGIGSVIVGGIKSGLGSAIHGVKGAGSAVWNWTGFAGGTRNYPGGWAMVGERGMELVNLPRGSRIFPAGQTRKMMGSLAPGASMASSISSGLAPAGAGTPSVVVAGAPTYNVTVYADAGWAGMSPSQAAGVIRKELLKVGRRNGSVGLA